MKLIKNYINKYLQYYNIFLKEDQKRYYFIYLSSHFFIIPSACALLNENYTTDGVHLNENGYTAWVDFIDDVILSLK